jgi:hypothetical protein
VTVDEADSEGDCAKQQPEPLTTADVKALEPLRSAKVAS